MAVVTKTPPETVARDPVKQRAIGSFLGALYVLLSLGVVFGQLPILWGQLGLTNEFLSEALLLIVTLFVMVGLAYVGVKLEGPHPQPGVHAGAFVAAGALFLIVLVSLGLGNSRAESDTTGLVMAVVSGLILTAGLAWLFLRPGFSRRLVRLEEQGFFDVGQYKPTQGVRVRRGTFVSLLVLIGCGIYTMVIHKTLGVGHWSVGIPGTDYALYLLFHINYLGPVVVLFLLAWAAWRVVNWPVFADFLIATEAELNKVSWTTRRRLVQDTIVVLVTVFLMALFLFTVDIIWIRVLNWGPIKVLQVDLREERAKQRTPTDW